MSLRRTANGALAGGAAAALWAAQQPLDKRLFASGYDDVELLGKLATRGSRWPAAGLLVHVQNGALFGAIYAALKPLLPGPPLARGVLAALAENFATWPLGRLVDRLHPARAELTPLAGNMRALAQATWRHFLFGVALAALEDALNRPEAAEPPPIPASTNGQGDLEAIAVPA